jgi:RNA polymerase sigma-70 factor (ECF subfamily)
MSETREEDLLAARSRDGDPKALAILYRRFAPGLLDYLTRVLGERSDAEDLLHETFLRIFEGQGRYEGRGRFRSWIYTVATHLARDRLRQRRRRGELAAAVAEALSSRPAADPIEQVARQELVKRIDSALADLPASYAMVFHLRVREEFSYHEIAEICDEPEGTLRSRVHHALKRIRQELERGGFEVPKQRQRKADPR